MALASFWLGCLPALAADPSADLLAAFQATYQAAPPLTRSIKEPVREYEYPEHIVEVVNQTANFAPALLVKRDHDRYALLVSETIQNVGHAFPGAFSVAYLDHNEAGWRLEQLWPELMFMGQTGIPADRVWHVAFWSEPLILAASKYCGMEGCNQTIVLKKSISGSSRTAAGDGLCCPHPIAG